MVIDVVDGSILRFIGRKLRIPREQKNVQEDIRSTQRLINALEKGAGDDGLSCFPSPPIVVYGMSNAIGFVVDKIKVRAGSYGMIDLLRFHGHGAPGMMGIAGNYGADMSRHLADLGPRRKRLAGRTLAELRAYFSPFGRVELHGCEVGKGKTGGKLIRRLANAFGVPVSAGIRNQYDSDLSDTFTFEGPVRTAYPGGKIKKTSWRNIPGGYSGF